MAFTNFEDFEKAFHQALETAEVECGDLGTITVREPAAIVFEPIDYRRRKLMERAQLDINDPVDQELIPEADREKPKSEWPQFSYLKFTDTDRAEYYQLCAEIICSAATNGNGQMLFEDKLDFVKSWPGGLLSQVSSEIVEFIRGDQEPENPIEK